MKFDKTILHINSYFLSNRIHYNFYLKLNKHNKNSFLLPVYKHFKNKHIEGVDIDYVFDSLDKKIFFTKIPKVLYLFFKKKYKEFDLIHAHTLISDGIPTYLIHLIVGKPYVVSVRMTDVHLFIDGSFVFRLIANRILRKSSAIFFISPSLKRKIRSRYPDIDPKKFSILPNGLDSFWQNNLGVPKTLNIIKNTLKILFVGNLSSNKNLDILLELLSKYKDFKYELHVVGENVENIDFDKINTSFDNENCVVYHGSIKDKDTLKQLFIESDVFAMLSLNETFGVVYIEALSQGLPVLYTQNEGFDGFFDNGFVGYSCDPNDVQNVHDNLLKVLSNYTEISNNAINSVKSFYWKETLQTYYDTLNSKVK